MLSDTPSKLKTCARVDVSKKLSLGHVVDLKMNRTCTQTGETVVYRAVMAMVMGPATATLPVVIVKALAVVVFNTDQLTES